MIQKIIMIIEDETAIRDLLHFSLSQSSYQIIEAENAQQAVHALASTIPHIIILDWMLPDKSGVELLKWLRQQELYQHIPVIMLTAKAEEENKIKGLSGGADDYMTKPFSPAELKARIHSILRRGPLLQANHILKIADLEVDTEKHTVHCMMQPVSLSPIEYKLLLFFMRHAGKVYNRDQLLSHVWGGDHDINDRTIDVTMRRLRDKLKPFQKQHLIKTIRGSGYLFEGK